MAQQLERQHVYKVLVLNIKFLFTCAKTLNILKDYKQGSLKYFTLLLSPLKMIQTSKMSTNLTQIRMIYQKSSTKKRW